MMSQSSNAKKEQEPDEEYKKYLDCSYVPKAPQPSNKMDLFKRLFKNEKNNKVQTVDETMIKKQMSSVKSKPSLDEQSKNIYQKLNRNFDSYMNLNPQKKSLISAKINNKTNAGTTNTPAFNESQIQKQAQHDSNGHHSKAQKPFTQSKSQRHSILQKQKALKPQNQQNSTGKNQSNTFRAKNTLKNVMSNKIQKEQVIAPFCFDCEKYHPEDKCKKQNKKLDKMVPQQKPIQSNQKNQAIQALFYRNPNQHLFQEPDSFQEMDYDQDQYDEKDSFIDDSLQDDDQNQNIFKELRNVTGYDPSRFKHIDDKEEVSEQHDFAEIEAEEHYTRQIARMEDERELKRIKLSEKKR